MKYNVTVRPLPEVRHWEVVEGFCYKGIDIPEGFDTDGASIPPGLRWRFKHGGAKFPAAVYHDYCYRTAIIPKEEADRRFFELMIENGVSHHDAVIMYNGVKAFGWIGWGQNRRKEKKR